LQGRQGIGQTPIGSKLLCINIAVCALSLKQFDIKFGIPWFNNAVSFNLFLFGTTYHCQFLSIGRLNLTLQVVQNLLDRIGCLGYFVLQKVTGKNWKAQQGLHRVLPCLNQGIQDIQIIRTDRHAFHVHLFSQVSSMIGKTSNGMGKGSIESQLDLIIMIAVVAIIFVDICRKLHCLARLVPARPS
jgi:hypothetical protein